MPPARACTRAVLPPFHPRGRAVSWGDPASLSLPVCAAVAAKFLLPLSDAVSLLHPHCLFSSYSSFAEGLSSHGQEAPVLAQQQQQQHPVTHNNGSRAAAGRRQALHTDATYL